MLGQEVCKSMVLLQDLEVGGIAHACVKVRVMVSSRFSLLSSCPLLPAVTTR